MVERTIEDRLRNQYFELLPEIRSVTEHLETEVKYRLLPLLGDLDKYEQLNVTSRIKACDSAIAALRRRQEGNTFDRSQPSLYSLSNLKDLAGVRVDVFPRTRLAEVNHIVVNQFPEWRSDPVPSDDDDADPLAYKYSGYSRASTEIKGEIQVLSMLIGQFWEVEHSTIYKPAPELRSIARSLEMQERTREVLRALVTFEETFERLIRSSPSLSQSK